MDEAFQLNESKRFLPEWLPHVSFEKGGKICNAIGEEQYGPGYAVRRRLGQSLTRSAGKKLRVAFYEGRVVGDDGNEFTRYIGKIVRNPNLCPVRVHKWEDLDSDNVNICELFYRKSVGKILKTEVE
ncbi:hypothetical protein SOVF_041030 [Spinacia oleracea]|uniref:Uncharacterized protein n=1 Tax=Spinacia oleracea TaxID=3562 RepID=A0ABM3R5W1_SPIOL|nr:uncharacterized protein LOC110791771 [Spinacia oleracea]KNA21675.1 hypothetical protein SOVF_041030 [Spinacia oleracea]